MPRHCWMGLAGASDESGETGWRACLVLLSFHYVRGLRTFLALSHIELNLIAFLQAFVALSGDRAVVHEHIRPI